MKIIDEIQIVECLDNTNVIINLTNGLADIIDDDVKDKILKNKFSSLDFEIIEHLKEREYLFDSNEQYQKHLESLINNIDKLELQEVPNFLFIPTYDCNLRCTYCYQRGYEIKKNKDLNNSIIDEFFEMAVGKVHNREKEVKRIINPKEVNITLMGGEPLMIENKDEIKYFIERCNFFGYSLNIVTNGTTIPDYLDIINDNNVKSIQVTLDGSKKIHDKRRFTTRGEGSYEVILKSISLLLKNKINTSIRINLDEQNIEYLPELARELSGLYGKNCNPYIFLMEHEGCMGLEHIIEDVDAMKRIYELQKEEPLLKKIDIAYIGKELIHSIFNDEPFYPAIRKCSASKSQYIYDYKANIYKCWWGIGNEKYKISNYHNNSFNKDDAWKERTIDNIAECKTCKYRFICGGGCVSRVAEAPHINALKGECRNFEKLYDFIVKEKIQNAE